MTLAIPGTTVGATFDASNNVRYTGGHLQVDLNGDHLFNAAQDFDISLSGVGSVTWNAATQQFGFGALPPPPAPTKVFALTFDDGPWTAASEWKPMDSTQYIFDILQRYGAKATFFEVGHEIETSGTQGPTLVCTMHDAGMLIENHTFDHAALPGFEGLNPPLTDAQTTDEFQRTSNDIFAATGETPDYYRPPYGLHNDHIDAIAASIGGMLPVTWTADTLGLEDRGRRHDRDLDRA